MKDLLEILEEIHQTIGDTFVVVGSMADYLLGQTQHPPYKDIDVCVADDTIAETLSNGYIHGWKHDSVAEEYKEIGVNSRWVVHTGPYQGIDIFVRSILPSHTVVSYEGIDYRVQDQRNI